MPCLVTAMPDEELPLIVRPDVALRVADTQSGRILSEMVTGALDIASSAPLVEERAELEFRIGEDYYYGRGKPQSVYVYRLEGAHWSRQTLDDGGMASAACASELASSSRMSLDTPETPSNPDSW